MAVFSEHLGTRPAKRRRISLALREESLVDATQPTTKSNEVVPEAKAWDNEGQVEPQKTRSIVDGRPGTRMPTQQRSVLPVGGVGKSSMMALQVNELLSQIRPKPAANLEVRLERLRSIIHAIPNRPAVSMVDAEKHLRKTSGTSIPFGPIRPDSNIKYQFEYQAPTEVNFATSLSEIDMSGKYVELLVVQMPASILQEKDYLNHRAVHKRAFYLACIAAALNEAAKDEFLIHYEYLDDNFLLPVIALVSQENPSSQPQQNSSRIKIMVSFPDSSIPIEKTQPDKNCVRSVHSAHDGTLKPTTSYNNSLRYAASASARNRFIADAQAQCESFDDAAELGRVWLQQRGIASTISAGGFGQNEWRTICALLLKTGGHKDRAMFSAKYSSLQLFKAMLQFLAGKDLLMPMITNGQTQLPRTSRPTLYDGNLGYNVLFKMSSWSYQLLKHEATLSVAAITSRSQDHFEAIFIVRTAEPLLRFDETYCLDLSGLQQSGEAKSGRQELLGKLHAVLSRGLGDRLKLMNLKTGSYSSWPITKTPAEEDPMIVELGLNLDAETASRLVDHGPLAEETEATADFRKFWGDKAELRRFKDGSISESLVWSEDMPVTLQIVRHLLQQHLGLPATLIQSCNSHASRYLSTHPTVKAAEAFKMVNNAYQTLTSQLHHLDALPLRVRSVAPSDPQLSSTSLACPLIPANSTPSDIVIEFENSARWPDSLPAIQYTKIAFLHKLADSISSLEPKVITRVGLENSSTATSGFYNTSYLDIIYPSPGPGLAPIPFRLRVKHDRELHLLSERLSSKSLAAPVHADLQHVMATHKRLLASTTHTIILRNLTTRFPVLSPAVRLVKKWASAHLLLTPSLLPERLLELFTIHVFTSPAPWSIPATPQTAFLRVLHLLARWDWAVDPLIVSTSLTSELTTPQTEEMRTRFQAWRKLDPGMNNVVLFVASDTDPTGVVWTQGAKPARVVATRLTALAKASIALVKAKGLQIQDTDWDSIFKSPLTDFDFLLHLKPSIVRSSHAGHGEKAKYKNLAVQEELNIDTIGFDPVRLFIQDLEHVFGQSALFFYDCDGGKVIAGLWNPKVLGRKEWRVRSGVSTRPVARDGGGDKDQVVVNQAGILAEMAIMGEGIVQRIEVIKDFVQL